MNQALKQERDHSEQTEARLSHDCSYSMSKSVMVLIRFYLATGVGGVETSTPNSRSTNIHWHAVMPQVNCFDADN